MEGSAAASATSAGSTQAGGNANIEQLQQLFDEFSQTLVALRTATVEGQQKVDTARARPQ